MKPTAETTNRRWLGFELNILRRLKFSTIAIPFAGQPDLDWYLKFWGKQVRTNDLCQWAWWMARGYVENREETLTEDDVSFLLGDSYVPHRRLHNPALGNYLSEMDAVWFDNLWLNLRQLTSPYRQALAISHALKVGDYVFSFRPETAGLKRPLSEVFVHLWRRQREIIDNGKENTCANLEAGDFIRQTRADLMFARFPSARGLAAWRDGTSDWREIWVRGNAEEWEQLLSRRRGKLGDTVLSKQHYLELVDQFLAQARHIPTWAISHTEDGFLSSTELADRIKKFRRLEVIYHKDFSEVLGGRNTYLMIAR